MFDPNSILSGILIFVKGIVAAIMKIFSTSPIFGMVIIGIIVLVVIFLVALSVDWSSKFLKFVVIAVLFIFLVLAIYYVGADVGLNKMISGALTSITGADPLNTSLDTNLGNNVSVLVDNSKTHTGINLFT